jgi:hypothetical protein
LSLMNEKKSLEWIRGMSVTEYENINKSKSGKKTLKSALDDRSCSKMEGSPPEPRFGHRCVSIGDSKFLIAWGGNGRIFSDLRICNICEFFFSSFFFFFLLSFLFFPFLSFSFSFLFFSFSFLFLFFSFSFSFFF